MIAAASAFRFATVSSRGVAWSLKRNCSVTPAQLGAVYAALCAVSAAIAGGFWWYGARLVAPFAGLELLGVGLAFLAYARHAADSERILLDGGRLVVEVESAGRRERIAFAGDRVRVEPQRGDGSLIELSAQGRSVAVGRHLRPELRAVLAAEIRRALRTPPGLPGA
jgi:uncharacterized membrane protein